ncbi:MAG: MFS transporter [Dehalococcoidia bacterium]
MSGKGQGTRVHYGWIVVFTGMLAAVAAHGFGRMSYTIILPEMRDGLGLTYTQAGLLATGNLIGYLVFAVIGGFLASRYGARRVISLSLLLMGICMLLTGIADSFKWAFSMRLLTGLGNGGAYVPAMALGSIWFTMRRRGFATGIVSGGIGVGTFLGGVIVPRILLTYGADGWRYSWYYLGGAVLFIALLSYLLLRDHPEDLGLEQVGASTKAKPEGDQNPAPLPRSSPSPTPTSPGITGKKPPPNLQWGLIYRVKEVWYLGLVYLMYGFSYVIYMTFFKAFLADEIGLDVVLVGYLWALAGGLSIFCGVIWGGISDRLGRKRGAALAYLTLALSYLLFAFFDTLPAFYLSVFLFGLSAWSIPTIMAAAAGDYMGPRLAPAGLGFITLFFGIGQALGPYVGGYLKDLTGTFVFPFILATAVSLVGMVGSLLLKKPATEVPAEIRGNR